MAEVALNRARIHAVVGQLVAARMAQHVRVYLHGETGSLACALHHRLKATRGERRAALADKHEW